MLSEVELFGDFPGSPVVKNPLSNAGDPSSVPRGTKTPHATGQLSLGATPRKADMPQ